jgi:hypothetical protein
MFYIAGLGQSEERKRLMNKQFFQFNLDRKKEVFVEKKSF